MTEVRMGSSGNSRFWAQLQQSSRSLLAHPAYLRPQGMTLEAASTEDLEWLIAERRAEVRVIEYILKCREGIEKK